MSQFSATTSYQIDFHATQLRMIFLFLLIVLLQIPILASKHQIFDVSFNRYSNWQLSSSSVRQWYDLSSSSDGKYVFGIAAGYGIYRSTNYGSSFSKISTTSSNWNAIASNAVGDKVIANDYINGIYLSSDYGATWSAANVHVNTGYDVQISSSSSGQYIYIATNTSTTAGFYNGFFYSSNYGSTFSANYLLPRMSGAVASSSDGQYVFLGRDDGMVSVSSDFGASFNLNAAASSGITKVTCSSSGQRCTLICNANQVFISADYGTTWSESSLTTTTNTASHHPYTDIAVSSTGQLIVVSVFNEYLYQSSDYGATWSQSSYFIAPWGPLTSDSSGLNLVTGISESGNLFYLHSNVAGGASPSAAPTTAAAPSVSVVPGKWNYSINLPYAQYSGISYSSSGQYVSVSASTTNYLTSYPIYGIYTSTDYGSSFTAATVNNIVTNADGTGVTQWTDVQTSSTGQFVLASELNNGVYLSVDFGSSFDTLYSPSNTYTFHLAASSDFVYMYAIMVDLSTNKEYWHRSTDGGSSWTSQLGSSTALTNGISATTISCSATGQYVAIAQSSTAQLFVSSNYGSYYLTPTSQSASYTWSDVAMSTTGQYIYVVSSDTSSAVLTSSDYGGTFTSLSTTFSGVTSITCNYAGKLLTLVTSSGSVYHSVDSGRSWVLQLSETEVQYTAVATNYISSHLASVGSPGFGYFLNNNSIASLPPTARPSVIPTRLPTLAPSKLPTRSPSLRPSCVPSLIPSLIPSALPSIEPSIAPFVTESPTRAPSDRPTTIRPSTRPTVEPSLIPSRSPTNTRSPTDTLLPTTLTPTQNPTTTVPTRDPASSQPPTEEPTHRPSRQPSGFPTSEPQIVPGSKSSHKHNNATEIYIGAIIAGVSVLGLCLYFAYRLVDKRRHHTRVYAVDQARPLPNMGDDDYQAPVIGNNLDVEAQFEEEVQRRLGELERLEQRYNQSVEARNSPEAEDSTSLLRNQEQLEDVDDDENEEEENVNRAFPLAHIENNPDGSVRDAVVVVAQWAPSSGHGELQHQHLPTDTGDLVEVYEGEAMQEGVVFVPDNYVVMVDASPV